MKRAIITISIMILAVLFTSVVNAQGNYPPLPSAQDLASGRTFDFIDNLYNSKGNDEAEAFNKAMGEFEEMQREWQANNIGKPAAMELLARYGEPVDNKAPRTEAELRRRANEYAVPTFAQNLDISAIAKMSPKEAEAYAMSLASKQTGLSASDLKKLERMNDKQAQEFLMNRQKEGTPDQQKYSKEKQNFDQWRSSERKKVVGQMQSMYTKKYRPLIENAEKDMEKCGNSDQNSEQCFEEAYRRWMVAKREFRVECYELWRNQITGEQNRLLQISKNSQFAGIESLISDDYFKTTLEVLTLPGLGINN